METILKYIAKIKVASKQHPTATVFILGVFVGIIIKTIL